MMEVAKKYAKENVDREGNVKERNLTKKQEEGLKDIEALMKDNHIVTKTDKSGRQCLLTEEEYIKTGEPHTKDDKVKNRKVMEKNEDILNCHTLQFARLLGLCNSQNCARRLKSALLNQNALPPACISQLRITSRRLKESHCRPGLCVVLSGLTTDS